MMSSKMSTEEREILEKFERGDDLLPTSSTSSYRPVKRLAIRSTRPGESTCG